LKKEEGYHARGKKGKSQKGEGEEGIESWDPFGKELCGKKAPRRL